ncbi:transmembrane protein 225B isoform X1 [Sarcophilus harrisii]|uniref:transmembrane protein 225B isoform X1 n=1 Tax=Sarcophilus harrisii TaxID=9305 RepID=UPI000226E577|nr:transmembrane protein 225B isoform X1 [Sarcophilus harrisii]
MEIKAHIPKEKPDLKMKTSMTESSPSHPVQIQYHITKRNLLSMRFMAVIFTTISWIIMLLVTNHPTWVILRHNRINLGNKTIMNIALWDNCLQCSVPYTMSVYIFLSRGIMFLNLVFTSLLILSMMCSFRRIFSRISKLDFIFSIANYISGLALFGCLMLFSMQVLDIFSQEGWNFELQWPFYLSSVSILTFFAAGTICLNSYKYSWNILYLSPSKLISGLKRQKLSRSLRKQMIMSIVPPESIHETTTGSDP